MVRILRHHQPKGLATRYAVVVQSPIVDGAMFWSAILNVYQHALPRQALNRLADQSSASVPERVKYLG